MTQFYLSLNPAKESGDVLLGGPSPLDPRSSLSGNTTVTVPPSTPVGTYLVLACADDSDTVSWEQRTE